MFKAVVRLLSRHLKARHYNRLPQSNSLVEVPLLEGDSVFDLGDWLVVRFLADSDCAPHSFQVSLIVRNSGLLGGFLSLARALTVVENRVRDLLLLRELELT